MKAVQFKTFGGPEVLEIMEVPQPVYSDDEILIKVSAAGINPIDAKIRNGSSFVAQKLQLPSGLGFDVCGVVEACGVNVTQFSVGDWVLGTAGQYDHPGTYAEYCVATEKSLVKKPDSLDPIKASALPVVGLTAWQAVYECAKVKAGERVLIHAAAGGVGHLVTQLAKQEGAYVIATASKKLHAMLTAFGVDEIIDYKEAQFDEVVSALDLVIDLVGGETGLRSLPLLKPGGRLLTVPTITRDEIIRAADDFSVAAFGMLAQNKAEDLLALANRIADGSIQLNIGKVFPLSQAAQAHAALESGQAQGKIVLTTS